MNKIKLKRNEGEEEEEEEVLENKDWTWKREGYRNLME